MDIDTTDPSYWLNWRFLICALYVFGTMVSAAFLIWKYEGGKKAYDESREPDGDLYKDEYWKTCLKSIHPVFLLAYRILVFCLLLALITGNTIVKGPEIFLYYTQLTFMLTTIYFGLASGFSVYGCWCDHDESCHFKRASQNFDVEQVSNVAPQPRGGSVKTPLLENLDNREEEHVCQFASFMCYLLQIIYQVAAGAVLLTDVVYWLVIYPLTASESRLGFFDVSMHSVNFLIFGDAILNCMRFPMFRIGYFILWTGFFVICQWIIHAFVSMMWPYPFMDLSSAYAPLWYFIVGLLHLPCYGAFALMVRLKHLCFSWSFSESYQGIR